MGSIVPIMSTKAARSFGEALFAKSRRRVLGLLFGRPDERFYLKEIVRLAAVGTGSVQRELERLAGAGLLEVELSGNQKYYRANRKAPIFEELRGIVRKSFGLADVLQMALGPLQDRIEVAFVYGSFAQGRDHASSDIDLMVIGQDIGYPELLDLLQAAEVELGRKVNPTLYSGDEFRNRKASGNAFLDRVLNREKVFLVGDEDALG